jgi:hypothetical protein
VRTYFLYGLLILFCAACGKGGAVDELPHVITDNDDTYPVLEITTPTTNQVFTSGSSINITGKVSDNSLYQGTISIRNDVTGAIVKEQYYEIHYIPVYNFNISHTISVTTATDFTVIVKFEDHGHNQTIKAVQVTVNP